MKRFAAWIKRHPQELRRFAKFLIVGVSSTLIDVGVFRCSCAASQWWMRLGTAGRVDRARRISA